MYRSALALFSIALAIPVHVGGCGKRPSREGPPAEPAAHAPTAEATDRAASRTLPDEAARPAASAAADGNRDADTAGPAGAIAQARAPDGADMAGLAGALLDAARALLAAFDEAGARSLALPWDSDARRRWYYTPRRRAGVALGDMGGAQAAATRALLAVVLSQRGRDKVEDILTLEGILGRVEGNPGVRDPGRYHVMLFGAPSPDAPWSWRFEGHHLSINVTQVGDAVASTPAFFGANPARVHSGPRAGMRVLAAEEDVARALFATLTEAQWTRARIAERAPDDLVTGNDPRARLARFEGLPASELTDDQRARLWDLVEVYTGNLHPVLARAHRARIERAGVGQLHIAWAGSREPGRAHYYRVHGPTHLIEYDNRGGNHIHAVFRDLEGDFGEDLLAQHLRAHQHPAPAAPSHKPPGR
jgi:Protein of unknown function (DUF3500)